MTSQAMAGAGGLATGAIYGVGLAGAPSGRGGRGRVSCRRLTARSRGTTSDDGRGLAETPISSGGPSRCRTIGATAVSRRTIVSPQIAGLLVLTTAVFTQTEEAVW